MTTKLQHIADIIARFESRERFNQSPEMMRAGAEYYAELSRETASFTDEQLDTIRAIEAEARDDDLSEQALSELRRAAEQMQQACQGNHDEGGDLRTVLDGPAKRKIG